ncbi:MAG TPA: hypothetical protein PL085_11595 [Agriterribacter sp.]|uniref:hypothetical protein n=1 Tax=Agriterribacter sp. TaxID=2821509 RepID=UPI002D17084A|nr:hypothetical protein [Agriterribacter sp.]HRQ17713.1 hypothetical protein [Agriterribacter sp.]
MKINNKFTLKQHVSLSTDTENLKRIVIGIKACADGGVLYELACGKEMTWHYDCEISVFETKKQIGFAV